MTPPMLKNTLNIFCFVAVAGLLFFGFQNCSPMTGIKSSLNQASSSVLAGSSNNSGISGLRQVEQQLNSQPSVQVLADANATVLQGRAICAIRGGAGAFLRRVDYASQADCQNACASFAATNPNRVCAWKNTVFFGDPTQACLVSGGGHAVVTSLAQATFSQCQASCDQAAAQHTYRLCDWGTDRFYQPPAATECRVIGGAGKMLLNPTVFSSLSDCQNLCQQFQSNTYRTCYYGTQILQGPTSDQRCDIWGGAGKNLTPSAYGSIDDCKASCASFTGNPNRICFYGKVRVQ